jgi:hypothetical protein
MSIENTDHFPVDLDRLDASQKIVFSLGNFILDDTPVEVTTLDQPANIDRVREFDVERAHKIIPELPWYGASLIQDSMRGQAPELPPYPRNGIESAAADISQSSLMGKDFARRILQRTFRQAHKTRTAISQGTLEVSEGFTMMQRGVTMPVSNLNGEVFDATIEQMAMGGEVNHDGTIHTFNLGIVATGIIFNSGRYSKPDRVVAVTTGRPNQLSWGQTHGDPATPLLLPGQFKAELMWDPRELPHMLSVIGNQRVE